MPVDYKSIRSDNKEEYGNIQRWGKNVFVNRYDDRTHFIFELLQNAEDALAKRGSAWNGKRSVTFSLSSNEITVSHYGKSFDEADVRGVCGIGESTKKELTDIGRFGIGFKSVYAFTDNPEIHSDNERFAIDSYVHPRQVSEISLEPEETIIRIPFRKTEQDAKDKIISSLRNLNTRTLLFLRQIEEIRWEDADDGISGLYMRSKPECVGKIARKIMLMGQDDENGDVEEEYIVFSKEVCKESTSVGHVEIAFALETDDDSEQIQVRPATNTELVVFFPTVLSTNLGFVMQGPYRTTPSRDNVPEGDEWNRYLVEATSQLLVDALRELRKLGLLSISALECLPLEEPSSRFIPLFDKVQQALLTEHLLPAYKGGHYAGQHAKLARSQDLRGLIDRGRLTTLFNSDETLFWLGEGITADRTPKLRNYLVNTLDVEEVDPDGFVRRLDKQFLEDQPDNWIGRLYKFLNNQKSYRMRMLMESKPLVRLENGTHTVAKIGEQPQAYLPTEHTTDFPTVRVSVCQSDESLEFLKFLGLREPDPVDDVIEHVLPKYRPETVNITDSDYQSDIKRILNAYDTDSREQRNRLVNALRKTRFIAAVDAVSGSAQFVLPEEAYQATEALKNLFESVPGVLFVDNAREELRGERIRALLRAVGTSEYLARINKEVTLTDSQKWELQRHTRNTRGETSTENYTLMGLDDLLSILPTLPNDEPADRAKMLWNALCMFQRNASYFDFEGTHRWHHRGNQTNRFTSHFVEVLNERAWIPDKNGVLHQPRSVIFDDTGWDENPTLLSKIKFMPNAVKELAEEAGFDPEMLVLLKQLGITSKEQVKELLHGADGETVDQPDESHGAEQDANTTTADAENPNLGTGAEFPPNRQIADKQSSYDNLNVSQNGNNKNAIPNADKRGSTSQSTREFISYVKVGTDESNESEGLTQQERLSLESQAIDLILSKEPSLQRTPTNNSGFDLFEEDDQNVCVRWVEVKSMKGSLENRPATLTRTQFKFAQEKQDAFWLYVVENAGDAQTANIIRIQNPAGRAKTFTFDHGWKEVAESGAG